ncbi:1,4-dihydroxy-2-naphthoyl-CoA synthase [Blattabacterium punctulatus]|uniref:1,4-dihydroxy-2-naphthoyl-CoA synthase n=1 Tax=Blattabacterium punctulatus TaxID=164514 RepID=A0ABN5M6A9_9FLAO|nr:1,4-dihydroxy-2-naphthoyl-CoA synthase [Blattabacterium punctulatus]AWU40113.1 1,4-dihydroxy-2-naphthoyl-CoA synthase [Blattabacterium punctulatus]AWU40655.1 1,4-dihydroxy-2-naphthoyl-CoA synthase [Blattabacterium punctulatus]
MYPKINWNYIKKYEDINFYFWKGISKIEINRPKCHNAFRVETVKEMIDAIDICRDRRDVDILIITGSGKKSFCSGGDQNQRGLGGYIGKDGIPRLNILDFYKKIREIPKPVIAMVNGFSIGGGHVLHVVCDLTISSNNAIFSQVGPKVGSFDGGFGASYLARHIGQKKTREMWFLCKKYSANEALKMGLINKVVPLNKLEKTTIKWCQLIQKRSPMSLRMIKRCLNAELDGQHGLMQLAGDATLMFYLMEESQEGKKAFLEKREPNFRKFTKFL